MRIDEYLLKFETLALQAVAADWRQALAIGTSLLEAAGAVEARYHDAILANLAAHGPYFVLVPGFAMPHARPEDGVRSTGFSLVTLRTPVAFGHAAHDPVSVILTIAAADATELNERVIVQVMQLLDWEPALERLRQARSGADLRRLWAEMPQEE